MGEAMRGMGGGLGGIWGSSVPATKFCCELKTTNKFYLQNKTMTTSKNVDHF